MTVTKIKPKQQMEELAADVHKLAMKFNDISSLLYIIDFAHRNEKYNGDCQDIQAAYEIAQYAMGEAVDELFHVASRAEKGDAA